MSDPIEIIAHRGFSARAPENTLAAIEAAITAGADAVEFDLHMSADGVPVLFHDATLERTTDGTGPVAALTAEELGKLDAGSWFDPSFAGEPVPTFAAALETVGRRVGRLYPEVKGVGAAAHLARIGAEAAASPSASRIVFISMDWDALGAIRDSHPDAAVGYIVEDRSRADEALRRSAGDPRAILDFRASILLREPELAARARAQGTDLAVWTVDDPADASRLLDIGVHRITTNRVDTLLAWRAGR